MVVCALMFSCEGNEGLLRSSLLHEMDTFSSGGHVKYCSDSIQTIHSSSSILRMECYFISSSKMTVTIHGVYGSHLDSMNLSLTCYKAPEVDENELVRGKAIDELAHANEFEFDDLMIDKYAYTLALRVGKSDGYSYPMTVLIPQVKDTPRSEGRFLSTDQVKVKPIDFTEDSFRCLYSVPIDNSSFKMNHYVVLFKGKITPELLPFLPQRIIAKARVPKNRVGLNKYLRLKLEGELIHNAVYTLAYLMGEEGDKKPNYNGLVAYSEFIVP